MNIHTPLLLCLLTLHVTFSQPTTPQPERTQNDTTVEARVADGESTNPLGALGNLPNPIAGLQQLFSPSSGSGRPMAVLGTFQTLFMPMPSLVEGVQQGQAIANGLGSLFKPVVDGVQSIQQG